MILHIKRRNYKIKEERDERKKEEKDLKITSKL
jgi:hypothetical protein